MNVDPAQVNVICAFAPLCKVDVRKTPPLTVKFPQSCMSTILLEVPPLLSASTVPPLMVKFPFITIIGRKIIPDCLKYNVPELVFVIVKLPTIVVVPVKGNKSTEPVWLAQLYVTFPNVCAVKEYRATEEVSPVILQLDVDAHVAVGKLSVLVV